MRSTSRTRRTASADSAARVTGGDACLSATDGARRHQVISGGGSR